MKTIRTLYIYCGIFCMLCFLRSTTVLAIDNSDCMDCHSDESLTKESTNNILQTPITMSLYVDEDKFNLSVHNINGITCVDCHDDIEELNYDEDLPHAEDLKQVCCANCHEDEANAFRKSVHMEIRNKGVTMTCFACHGYHYVPMMDAALLAERENKYCLRCHNPYQYHQWLPAGESHFAMVECVVCHAPDVPQHINLHFLDLVSNKLYTSDEILSVLGIEQSEFMPLFDRNKDNMINLDEFETLVLVLRQRNVHARFHAELVAELMPLAHEVRRGAAEKTCENCHSVDSPYFDSVYLVFRQDDGSVHRHEVERAVLGSYYMNHFYLMSGTRIDLLDKIGFFILAAGAATVFAHATIRIFTIPLRRRKKNA